MKIDATVAVGFSRSPIRIPVKFGNSQGREVMIYAGRGVAGWFGDGQVVAVRDAGGWRSKLEWPLYVLSEKKDGRWGRVASGRILP